MRLPFQKKEKRSELSATGNWVGTLLSVLFVVAGITTGAFAIFPANHSASSSDVRSVPTLAAGASVVEPTIKDPFSSIRRTAGSTFQVTAAKRPVLLETVPNLDDDKHEAAAAATAPFFVPDPAVPVDVPQPVEDPVTTPFSASRRTHAAAGIPNQTKSGPSVQDALSVAIRVSSLFGEETEVEPPPATTTELALEQLFRIHYLRGSSSTKNGNHNHDHDHARLLAVARIGQKPTMDKPNKYFNLFWCSLLISILGLSSFVVQRISKTIKMPNHLEDNYGRKLTDGEGQVRAALMRNKNEARGRGMYFGQFNRDDFNDREKYIFDMYFYLGADGRYLCNLEGMALDILDGDWPDLLSSVDDKKWANVLLQMYKEACYDPNEYGEWHHIAPLCMCGSIEDLRNYIRLRPELHLMVHAALLYFFRSKTSLANSLTMMLNCAEKGNLGKNLSEEELENYLKRADEEKELFGFAKRLNSKAASVRMKIFRALGGSVIATGASYNTESKRLRNQRKQLRIKGVYFSGPYTQEEINLYKARFPNKEIEFTHFPRDNREVRKRYLCQEHEYDEGFMVDLEDTDIVMNVNSMSRLLYSREGNAKLKRAVNDRYDAYMAVDSKYTGAKATAKLAICYEILHLMEDDGYRFVTAVGEKQDDFKWFEPTHKVITLFIQRAFQNLTGKKKQAVLAERKPKIISLNKCERCVKERRKCVRKENATQCERCTEMNTKCISRPRKQRRMN